MWFLKKWFGTTPQVNAATAKIDEQVYFLNYRNHYAPGWWPGDVARERIRLENGVHARPKCLSIRSCNIIGSPPAPVLGDQITPCRLAELFLFRAWTAQFGYRVFSSNPTASEKLIGETINASKYLGLVAFQQVHGFSLESELGAEFIDLVEDRWRDYDVVVSTMPKADRLPTMEIVGVLANRLSVADPVVTYGLSMDFLRQLDLIKRTAMEIGVLAG